MIIILLAGFQINSLFAQENSNTLTRINSLAEAQAYADAHPDAALDYVEKDWHPSYIPANITLKKAGYIFKAGKYTCKLVQVDSQLLMRVSYIFLSGEKYTKAEADKLRAAIIENYRSGTSFTSLVKKYSMDSNETGDTNWFTEKMMVPEFENAVKAHKKGDIFTVDTPSMNWYHVVLKTYDEIYEKKFYVLKVKSKG